MQIPINSLLSFLQALGAEAYGLDLWDYIIFALYFVILTAIGLWVGRHKKKDSEDYFLAGRSLPWYAVGGSYIASNISSEQFIGMVGAAFIGLKVGFKTLHFQCSTFSISRNLCWNVYSGYG